MQQEPLISVIIPVYNKEQEIARTLDSVCAQSYHNLQIIVVNDGSSDRSGEICRGYAARDSRIRLIEKQNEGLPMARRTGLSVATGDYIHHLDGGDYLDGDAYRQAVGELCRNDFPDAVLFGFYYETPDGRLEKSKPYPEIRADRSCFLLRHIWTTQQYNAVWQYLYRKTLAEKLTFDGRLTIGEDTYYTSQLFYTARRIVMLDAHPVHYLLDEKSMTRAPFSEEAVRSVLLFPELIDRFMRDKPEYASLEMELLALRLQSYAMIILGGRLERMGEMVGEFRAAFRRYPALRTTGIIKRVRKLVDSYGRNPLRYRFTLWNYRRKGKIARG